MCEGGVNKFQEGHQTTKEVLPMRGMEKFPNVDEYYHRGKRKKASIYNMWKHSGRTPEGKGEGREAGSQKQVCRNTHKDPSRTGRAGNKIKERIAIGSGGPRKKPRESVKKRERGWGGAEAS